MKKILISFLMILLSACSVLKVVPLDPKTGYYPAQTEAKIILNKPIDLDKRKSLLLITDEDFVRGQITNMHYFDSLMTLNELETRIVQANLTDKIPSVADRIGINNAAKNYKDFLWFRVEFKKEGYANKSVHFILTDPQTMEDIFITETELDYAWKGVNDQYNWYPMFNAMLKYIRDNSKTYK